MNSVRKFLNENDRYVLALALAGAFVHVFNLHVPLFWDDIDWIVNNFSVHALTWANLSFIFTHDVGAAIGDTSNFYRPLLLVGLAVNWVVSGENPVSYHITNDLIHIVDGILMFYLLSRWLGSRRAAFLAALLFVIHPLQTEAITFISGLADPLWVFFTLTGIILYLNGRLWFAGAALILSVFTRENGVLGPAYLAAALIAFDYDDAFWLRVKKTLAAMWPYLGIGVVYVLLRLTVLNFRNTLNFYEQHQNFYSTHLSYRLYTFLHVLVVYARLIVWPTGLHFDRDVRISLHIWDHWSWLGALALVGLVGVLFGLWRRSDKKAFNVWFFGAAVFFLNLAPTSGIIPINARLYEHWLYFSLFGCFTVVAWYLDRIWLWLERNQKSLVPLFVIGLGVCGILLSIQTIRRNLVWEDTEKFYLDILHYEPRDVRALNNLGMLYANKGNFGAAAPLFTRAISADPTVPAPYWNLGTIAVLTGHLSEAEGLFQKTITAQRSFHRAYRSLAAVYAAEKRLPEALAELEKLEQIYPSPETEANIAALKKDIAGQ